MLWIPKTGAQWRRLPRCYANLKTVHRCLSRPASVGGRSRTRHYAGYAASPRTTCLDHSKGRDLVMVSHLGAAVACSAVILTPVESDPTSAVLRVSWSPAEAHRTFFVALRETVPNGPRLQTSQRALTDPVLRLVPSDAQALTKFEVTVNASCEGGGSSAPVRTEVLSDRRGRCSPPGAITQSHSVDGFRANWSSVHGATMYRVLMLDLNDGQSLWRGESVRAEIALPATARPALLQVQAVCASLVSAPAHLLLIRPD